MKNILCFGDSNTWGYMPGTAGERYPFEKRWPGVMQRELGEGYQVLEAGLNGRMTVWDDPMSPGRCGKDHLPTILEMHTPLDLVIIALGVNDLKHHMNLMAIDLALGVGVLAQMVQDSGAGRLIGDARVSPDVLLLCPALPVQATHPFGHKLDGAVERSVGLVAAYEEIAKEQDCMCFDANAVANSSAIDGVHLDDASWLRLGKALAGVIKSVE